MTDTDPTTDNPTTEAELEGTATEADTETTPAKNKREAKYRRQLRDTETERDTLRSTVEALQRAEAERLSGLDKPAALWAAGTTLPDVLDDDGHVDAAKVKDAAATAADALGAAPRSRPPQPDPTQGGRGAPAATQTFADAFSPKR